ncbi:fructose-1,6-bisphosphatase [Lactococcus piscium]|uniref:fructose-1,6-bisphosphatase n=1 Tax=Pseudolactococcus carnosus TaxID=2749961 RepID=UPI0015DC2904|nr:fructose-1,6-bisphosphatase [Lactococcus carnosus]MCJ1972456.1 fructose-1,6-bisphosphatase [Lactococcus carnosus]MCJ1975699.1 fructose-1,6-bisphosphatase [Lactococcus carnosus]MCJ1985944.1 fructose-1,6-bisphosphatase [Lactococcus carnosus]MCJ1987090.1 fructose-1,6-bisphosphatase [Lactococcus carnosus]MCJ2004207.1 fructose-1,6-bisphosphatase [Lactococcus carnosus]
MSDNKYLALLAEKYETTDKVKSELVNLEAILNLPKGTELYISDIHAEYKAFNHIIRTGAGNIKEKIDEIFPDENAQEMEHLAMLIAYPTDMLQGKATDSAEANLWSAVTINRLLKLLRHLGTKYSRSKVRKAIDADFRYFTEELMLSVDANQTEKKDYYQQIIKRLIELDQDEKFIRSLCITIQELTVDHLHVVGDVFDRGAGADKVMDRLIQFHNVDFQWGNHDVLWMGAYAGNLACLATLLRIAVKYNYLYELEAAYGLNLRPLFLFAEAHYTDNNSGFTPAPRADDELYGVENQTRLSQVHQALSIIQFKLEGQIISRRPDFEMADRNLLERIDYEQQTINLAGQIYTLKNACFQTISPELPNQLTDGESYVMTAILSSLQKSEKFQRHMHFLVEKGSVYLVYNRHLLYHGCMPLKDDGSFLEMQIEENSYSGRALLDKFDTHIRRGIHYPDIGDDYSTDLMWYAWAGKCSPLFGRSSMTTFERYFIADKKTHQEGDNAYFTYREDPKMMTKILAEFGLTDPQSVVINGHTPVKVGDGESPIKAAGKLMVIDGGMSKAYQKTTGIAGYSLLNDSYGFKIVTHAPFTSIADILAKGKGNESLKYFLEEKPKRRMIKDTTIGDRLRASITDLNALLDYMP